MPTSMMSQPDSTSAVIAEIEVVTSGKPVGRYPISADRPSARHASNRLASRSSLVSSPFEQSEPLRCRLDVLVPTAGQVHQNDRSRTEFKTQLQSARHGVRRLDGRDDALEPAQQRQRVHRLGVGDRLVLVRDPRP